MYMGSINDIIDSFMTYLNMLIVLFVIIVILVLLLFSAQVGMGYMELNRIADIIKDEGDKAGYFSSDFYEETVDKYFTQRGIENKIKAVEVTPGFDVKPKKIGDISTIVLSRDSGFYKIFVTQKVSRVIVNRGYYGEGY